MTRAEPVGAALLRRKGILVECAASTLNSLCQRVDAGQAGIQDFTDAQIEYELMREDFREGLAEMTGQSSAWIERVLAL